MASLIPILVICIFIFTFTMMFSPKLRAKMLSKQIKSLKHTIDYSKEDLENLISIVYHHKDALWESGGRGEGSCRWDLAQFEFEDPELRKKYRRRLYNDSRKLKKIWAILQKEAAEKGYKDRWGHL